ncbi:glycosyltransferase [Acuticoccus sp. I52.16.1]|uniref:glycosyltransferase n=1 Tax=Acuticoccus sp. I52.16.1 TaxID=2928472 RepID=UPI001FCFD53D|nr:glycosyltransferase [Acuticoccus sp. I52.16.1]UOM34191.1 glycosyltransferase [Acuticoccus sp. I52.16.1]
MRDRAPSVAVLSSAPSGGAGIAAKRLAEALAGHGVACDFIDIAALGENVPEDARPSRSFSNRTVTDTHFTVEHPGFCRGWLVEMLAAYDIVNVHWALGLIALEEMAALARRGVTLVLTLHDFHYVSGGCHYPAGCGGMAVGCHACPQIDRSLASLTVPPRARRFKEALFAHAGVHLTAPSHYVRDGAVATRIVPPGRAHVIRNAYQPLSPAPAAREGGAVRLMLIADSLAERRKNMRLALEALALLAARLAAREDAPEVVLDLVGASDAEVTGLVHETGLPATQHGRIAEHAAITEIYRRADLLLTPSLEDNWPNILVEAGVYGVLPVAGPGHGCEEFIRSFDFGVVAGAYTVDAFADALERAVDRLAPGGAAHERLAGPRAEAARAIRIAHAPDRIAGRFLRRLAPPAGASVPAAPLTEPAL